jgi:hypothetical protein
VTITMPIHPHVGRPLAVVRWLVQRGVRYVDLESPQGSTLRVPVEWTDHGAPMVVAAIRGRAAKLDLGGLRRLAEWVGEKLDRADESALTVEQDEAIDAAPAQRRRREQASSAGGAVVARVGRDRSGRPLPGSRRARRARPQLDEDAPSGRGGSR